MLNRCIHRAVSYICQSDDAISNDNKTNRNSNYNTESATAANVGDSSTSEENLEREDIIQSAAAFIDLPDPNEYPTYYEIVKQPTCLNHIKAFAEREDFSSIV